jgi:hypothetical protein
VAPGHTKRDPTELIKTKWPLFLLMNGRQEGVGNIEGRKVWNRHHLDGLGWRCFIDEKPFPCPRVVDDDVRRPQFFRDPLRHSRNRLRIRQVDWVYTGYPARRGDLSGHLL